MYIEKIEVKGRTLDEAILRYKEELESKMIVVDKLSLQLIDENKYVAYDEGVVASSSEIIEESNYYPFGLKHKGYNGKEFNEELRFERYDFEARDYDVALGRWMNIDFLAEQMRRWSPYNVFFNNPLRFIDTDVMTPEDLIFKFQNKKDRKALQSNLDNGLGEGGATIDENGKVSLNVKREDLKTDEQKAFFDVINEASAPNESDVVINVTSGSEEVFIGNFETETIDIKDVNKFEGNDVTNENAILGHEIAEQTTKQRNNLPNTKEAFNEAHYGDGFKAEDAISGNSRMPGGVMPKGKNGMTPGGRLSITGQMKVNFLTKKGSIKTIGINIKKNNIKSVKTLK